MAATLLHTAGDKGLPVGQLQLAQRAGDAKLAAETVVGHFQVQTAHSREHSLPRICIYGNMKAGILTDQVVQCPLKVCG